jgi:hypothetical protein
MSPEFSSGGGNEFRAFDSRPVSCHMQPSVVSLYWRRDMLRANNASSPVRKQKVLFSLLANPNQKAVRTTSSLARSRIMTIRTPNMSGVTKDQ